MTYWCVWQECHCSLVQLFKFKLWISRKSRDRTPYLSLSHSQTHTYNTLFLILFLDDQIHTVCVRRSGLFKKFLLPDCMLGSLRVKKWELKLQNASITPEILYPEQACSITELCIFVFYWWSKSSSTSDTSPSFKSAKWQHLITRRHHVLQTAPSCYLVKIKNKNNSEKFD